MNKEIKKQWFKVLNHVDELAEGRVMTVTAGRMEICLTHYDGKISALTNKCPHQGGPLGEGSIEKGYLRCPWHGWDYHPCTGQSPGGFDERLESYEVKVENDAVYVGVPEKEEHVPNISDVMVGTMVKWGVRNVFGMVGHSNLGMADAMRRAEEKGFLKFIGIRHEGAAAFAASAYGKLTGKPAACFSIAGPGATNMFTGMWDAKVDRVPLLALTGQVANQVVSTGNFQEVDLAKAFMTVAEFNHTVQAGSNHAEMMSLAVKHALINRDVSHITFPDEIQTIRAEEGEMPKGPEGRMPSMKMMADPEVVEDAVDLLSKSKRPVIIVGHGARFHMDEVIEIAENLNCPILTTFKGKGQISDLHPLAGGVLGRSGTPVASWFMNESDCLLVIGASFSNHTGITDHKPTIQIDFDRLALAKFHKIDIPIWGEISSTLQQLSPFIEEMTHTTNQREEIQERWAIWKAEKRKRLAEYRKNGLSSSTVFEALNRLAPEDAVVTVDVGNNAYSLGRYFESKKNTFLMSGYLGSIGFALPAAIGAYAAVGNQRPVMAIAGDGGICQYLAELTTLVHYDIPVKVIVLNNNELGKISKEQRAGEFVQWKTKLSNPDFAEYAGSMGIPGFKVTEPEMLDSALIELFKTEGPALLEIFTDVKLI
ncbi:MAG: thiamine pyrophosphate-dependent enzyme [Bacteroidales bacterium]